MPSINVEPPPDKNEEGTCTTKRTSESRLGPVIARYCESVSISIKAKDIGSKYLNKKS